MISSLDLKIISFTSIVLKINRILLNTQSSNVTDSSYQDLISIKDLISKGNKYLGRKLLLMETYKIIFLMNLSKINLCPKKRTKVIRIEIQEVIIKIIKIVKITKIQGTHMLKVILK